MPRPSASPALRVLRTLRTGSRMTLRRHKDFLALAGALQKIAGYRGLLAVRASPFPWLAAIVYPLFRKTYKPQQSKRSPTKSVSL